MEKQKIEFAEGEKCDCEPKPVLYCEKCETFYVERGDAYAEIIPCKSEGLTE